MYFFICFVCQNNTNYKNENFYTPKIKQCDENTFTFWLIRYSLDHTTDWTK